MPYSPLREKPKGVRKNLLQEVIEDDIGEYSEAWLSNDPKHQYTIFPIQSSLRLVGRTSFFPLIKAPQKSLDLAQVYTASKWEDQSLNPELIFPGLFSLQNTYALGLYKLPVQQSQNS